MEPESSLSVQKACYFPTSRATLTQSTNPNNLFKIYFKITVPCIPKPPPLLQGSSSGFGWKNSIHICRSVKKCGIRRRLEPTWGGLSALDLGEKMLHLVTWAQNHKTEETDLIHSTFCGILHTWLIHIFVQLLQIRENIHILFFYRGHPAVLIMTVLLHITQSPNTTCSMYLITSDILGY